MNIGFGSEDGADFAPPGDFVGVTSPIFAFQTEFCDLTEFLLTLNFRVNKTARALFCNRKRTEKSRFILEGKKSSTISKVSGFK